MLKFLQEIADGNHVVGFDVVRFLYFVDGGVQLAEDGVQLCIVALLGVCDGLEVEVLLLELVDSVGHYLDAVLFF